VEGRLSESSNTAQGVTTEAEGSATEWTVVPVSDASFQLKSWKGDYLHRPSTPEGVTTWSSGTWTAEVGCGIGQVSLDGVSCGDIASLTNLQRAARYAPQVWMHGQEKFFPSSVDHFSPTSMTR